jgi:hypothetical protein
MALIWQFREKRRERYSVHQEIEVYYSIFERDSRSFIEFMRCIARKNSITLA